MTETQELVTRLLAEGAKEFPHQWETKDFGLSDQCTVCKTWRAVKVLSGECPILLRAALDLTLKERDDDLQQRMDAVVEAAVEWHQSGREGDNTWFDKSEVLSQAINHLLELREPASRVYKPVPSFQPPDTCPDCLAGVPFDKCGKHVTEADNKSLQQLAEALDPTVRE